MHRSLAMLLGGVGAVLLLAGAVLLIWWSGGGQGNVVGAAPAGMFDFPQAAEAGETAGPQRFEAVRPPSAMEADQLERPATPIAEQVRGLSPVEVLMQVEARRHESMDRADELELDGLAAEAFDRLWWQRIEQLMAQRDAARRQLASLRAEHAQATDARRRAAIAEEINALMRQAQSAADELERMGYLRGSAPDVADAAQLQRLREQRDTATYETWQRGVLRSLARTQGRNPWAE